MYSGMRASACIVGCLGGQGSRDVDHASMLTGPPPSSRVLQELQQAVQIARWSSDSDVVFLAEASALSRQDLYQVYYSTSYALYPRRVWLAAWCDAEASASQCETTNARATAESAIARHGARHVVIIGRRHSFPHARRHPVSGLVSLLELLLSDSVVIALAAVCACPGRPCVADDRGASSAVVLVRGLGTLLSVRNSGAFRCLDRVEPPQRYDSTGVGAFGRMCGDRDCGVSTRLPLSLVRAGNYPCGDGRGDSGWPDRLLVGLLILEFLALVAASLRTSLGFDGLFNFEMKARLMFEHPVGRLPLAYLSDASRAWSHPQYPLMVPFAELWVYTWLGRVDHTAVKILFPLFYFSLVAIMCGFVRRMAGVRVALAFALPRA